MRTNLTLQMTYAKAPMCQHNFLPNVEFEPRTDWICCRPTVVTASLSSEHMWTELWLTCLGQSSKQMKAPERTDRIKRTQLNSKLFCSVSFYYYYFVFVFSYNMDQVI